MGYIGNEIESLLFDGTRFALEAAALEGINHARSKTGNRVQGAEIAVSSQGDLYYRYSDDLPKRDAHPGGWADVTGLLANSYDYETDLTRTQATITFINEAEYAEDLDERAGYWVLSGLLDNEIVRKTFDNGLEGYIDAN